MLGLPGLDAQAFRSAHYAGHLSIDRRTDSRIFYWLFEAEGGAANKPLLVWLNGGPGCSSMDGLFLEVGPLRVDGDRIGINPHSWHRHANLLFVDQPVGTGFSFTRDRDSYPSTYPQVSEQFHHFLLNFFRLHTRFLLPNNPKQTIPIYICGNTFDIALKYLRCKSSIGESHAGIYIPYMVQTIFSKNGNRDIYFDVRGIALCNPWIEPFHQYDVSEFAYGMGFISKGQLNLLKQRERRCRDLLSKKKYNQRSCTSLLDEVLDASTLRGHSRLVMYDARKFATTPSFPPQHEAVERYLNRAEVRAALHVSACPHRFAECTDPPYNALLRWEGLGSSEALANILDKDVPVLVFSGVHDVICNHLGVEKALRNLKWKGRLAWLKASASVWLLDKRPVGYLTSHANLHNLKVLDAGHMVADSNLEADFPLFAF